MFVPIIYQDEDIVVVNKPVGLTTHPSETNDPARDNVVTALRRQSNLAYLGVHHRLDREVSGVLVFAARKEANAGLAKEFEGRTVQKEYLALVAGRLPKREGVIEVPLVEVGSGRYAVARPHDRRAQAAITHYKMLQTAADGSWSIVRLQLETGRTHQLRLHLAHLNTPIVGDTVYGPNQKFPRLLLHAVQLDFRHPITGAQVSYQATPPAIIERALARQALPELKLAQRLITAKNVLTSLSPADEIGLGRLLDLAILRRAPLAAAQSKTNTYRLLNGVADGFPGVTLDRYNSVLALQLDSPTTNYQTAKQLLLKVIESKFPDFQIHLDNQLLSANEASKTLVASPLMVQEDGLSFTTGVGKGWSLELRELRERVRAWSQGHKVLNCGSDNSGFEVVTLAGGATQVLSLMATQLDIETGLINVKTNNFIQNPADFIAGDIFVSLKRLASQKQLFDLIIVAQTKDEARSNGNYRQLARLAGQIAAPGGRLIVVNRDDRLERRTLRQQLQNGLEEAGRTYAVVALYHQPELDFPRLADTDDELKIVVFRID